jgi:type IV secretory pathway protease TraF
MDSSQYTRVLGKLSTKLDALGMSDTPHLMSSPALMAKIVTIVGLSTDTVARTFTGTLRNVPVSVPALQLYVTDSTRQMARGTDVPVTNGTFTFSAPPSSVFTLTYPGAAAQ